MDEQRITASGKQLMMDGRHLADCIDDRAAVVIAICLNCGRLDSRLPQESRSLVEEFFA